MQLVVAVFIGIIVYAIQSRLYRRLWDHKLFVELNFNEEYVVAGGSGTLTECVTNAKKLPLPILHVKFSAPKSFTFEDAANSSVTDYYHRNDVYSVMGEQRIKRTFAFKAGKRGYYSISAMNIISKSLFLNGTFAKTDDCDTCIYVLPEKLTIEAGRELIATVTGEIQARRSLVEDPFLFRGMREYMSTDPVRSINWKASARQESPIVNLYGYTAEHRVKLMLNVEPNVMVRADYMYELCVSLASTLACKLIETGVPVEIVSNGLDELTNETGTVEWGASKEHELTCDRYLARINGSAGQEYFNGLLRDELKAADSSITYVIISSYMKEDMVSLLDAMTAAGADLYMIAPYFDIDDARVVRDYIRGMEVKLDEA
ncbi:MAG: DUF58 domain-containing protein [Lachnospiraceae bacterium]|nr:DUF58 domain-containing protein [Lachnospiraceae bacterium]